MQEGQQSRNGFSNHNGILSVRKLYWRINCRKNSKIGSIATTQSTKIQTAEVTLKDLLTNQMISFNKHGSGIHFTFEGLCIRSCLEHCLLIQCVALHVNSMQFLCEEQFFSSWHSRHDLYMTCYLGGLLCTNEAVVRFRSWHKANGRCLQLVFAQSLNVFPGTLTPFCSV